MNEKIKGPRKGTSMWQSWSFWLTVFFVVFVISSWLWLPFWVEYFTGRSLSKTGDVGTLGDMYGLINALFTGLSIIALVVTILIQQNEIVQSRRLARHERFESTFFKYIDLRNDLFKALEPSFANFEAGCIVANLTKNQTLGVTKRNYQYNVEQQFVIKNFVNYLEMFAIMVNAINRKKEFESRTKYYALLSAQLHVNERRFFLYHFTLTKELPPRWDELKVHILAGLTGNDIHPDFRGLLFI